uniref:ARID DNA-binding domain-containing protein n=1 Tax=Tanacetum cinerariifolium TaxID=118510 RepID=A0A6L2K9K1_TANCI|nr:ARID DNA-binding domain-containing protein [Tanacetum cinerariifolium]
MGHIVKFCLMDNKDEDMVMNTNTRNLAKERKEGFKTTKPTVMLKYPESIHFSTTCMIKGTDHANWDDIWYISNHIDKYLCYKLDSLCNIKEDFSVKKLENQKKFLFTYGIGKVLIEDGGQEFDTIGEILGLSKGNGEEIKRCYINYLDVFTSYFKNARAPQQEYNGRNNQPILKKPTREIEEGKDKNCLMSHQWDFCETGASIGRSAVLKGKGKLEHFGVKLEDTEEGKDSQEQPILSHSTKAQNLQGMDLGPSTSRISDKEDSCNNTSYLVPGVHYAPEVTLNILSMDLLEKQGFKIKYDSNICTLVYMFNNKETQNFDEDRMRTMQNKYLEDYFESLTNKDEGIEEDLIRIKGNLYSTKVQTFNEYVIFLNLFMQDDIVSQEWDFFRNRFNKVVKWFYNHYLERSLPGPIPPTINGVQVYLFDLYKLIEGLGGYLSVYFCQEFDTIGKIMGLSRGNGEEIKKCYMNYLDVFTSYFKTARAPPQGNTNILDEATRNVEDKDIDCLVSHQWDFGETGAHIRKSAVPKGKETLEHFGVKLEDTRDSQDQPILTHSTRNQNLQGILPTPVTSRMTRSGDLSSSKTKREDGRMEVIVWEIHSENEPTAEYIPMDMKLTNFEGNIDNPHKFYDAIQLDQYLSCDNVRAVYLSCNPVQHQRTKHIEIDIHFVHDLVAAGQVRVLHMPSHYQYADIFTKGLPSALFEEFRSSLSVRWVWDKEKRMKVSMPPLWISTFSVKELAVRHPSLSEGFRARGWTWRKKTAHVCFEE